MANGHVVKRGTYLYDGKVPQRITILRFDEDPEWAVGCDDDAPWRDHPGPWFEVHYTGVEFGHLSLESAIARWEAFGVTWDDHLG